MIKRNVGVKNAHGVAATTHAGQHGIGLWALAARALEHFGHLHHAFVSNHALKIPNDHGVRVWACYGANDVEGVVYIGHPVAHGFVKGVFEGFTTAFDGHHCGTQQFHAVHIGALAFDVLAAHVHHTFQAIAGADGGGGHAVLAGTCFSNDAGFAHAARQHGLSDGVVDFVRACVVKVFALEKNLCAALFAAHARRMVNGRGAAHKMGQFVFEFG